MYVNPLKALVDAVAPQVSSVLPFDTSILSPLDGVTMFFELVFSGSEDDSAAWTAFIDLLIEDVIGPDYTYDGHKMPASALIAWRKALLKEFPTLRFTVDNSLSQVVGTEGTPKTTGVCISWHLDGTKPDGQVMRLTGMNLVAIKDGKALSNNQLGDAENGWKPVPKEAPAES